MLRPILLHPNPKLKKICEPVLEIDDSLIKLSDDMLETMYEGSGIGLAATQVDVHKRVIVVDISEKKDEPLVLINPVLNKVIDPELKTYSEGCLSVPGFYEELERPSEIEISFQDVNGQDHTLIANGLLSVVVQHEMDHLEGKMMVDSISNVKREMIRKKLSKAKGT